MHLRALRSPLARASLVALTLVLLAEALSRAVLAGALGAPPLPAASPVRRNPHALRGWLEWTRPPAAPPPGRLAIVITNSQGWAPESTDAEAARDTWPAHLGAALAPEGWRVLNWSLVGARAAELTVLAAATGPHHPALVIVAATAESFSQPEGADVWAAMGSDLGQVASLPDVRRALAPRFTDRVGRPDALAWVGARVALVRLGRWVWEPRGRRWTWPKDAAAVREVDAQTRLHPWHRGVTGKLHELRDTLAAAGGGAPWLLVDMPVCGEIVPAAHQDRLTALETHAPPVMGRGGTFVAGRDVVPCGEFYRMTHLKPEGHARFGVWMAARARQATGAP